jgi:hypothetical protein
MAKAMMVVHVVAEPEVPAASVQWGESVESITMMSSSFFVLPLTRRP